MLVLLLHHVGAPPPEVRQRKLYITVEALAAHVRWLQKRGARFSTLAGAMRGEGDACVTFDDGFTDVLEAVPALRALHVPATVFAVTSRVGDRSVVFDSDEGVAPSDLMTWEQLGALREAGWEIGSHGHAHVRLPTLENLNASAAALREHFREATTLAYPYGKYDAATIDAAKAAGFTAAATTRSGQASRDEPYRLRRVILSSFGALDTFERLKLFGVQTGLYPLRARPL